LADRENKADLIIGMDLTHESQEVRNILIDLAQRESMNLAARLATSLIAEMKREVTLLRNAHRFAGFAVLKSPDIPSVLIEMGYLSNKEDQNALTKEAYRGKLMTAVVRGLDRYFKQQQQVAQRG
jgi:N-acetylmuramoyl-L-alanine amidase